MPTSRQMSGSSAPNMPHTALGTHANGSCSLVRTIPASLSWTKFTMVSSWLKRTIYSTTSNAAAKNSLNRNGDCTLHTALPQPLRDIKTITSARSHPYARPPAMLEIMDNSQGFGWYAQNVCVIAALGRHSLMGTGMCTVICLFYFYRRISCTPGLLEPALQPRTVFFFFFIFLGVLGKNNLRSTHFLVCVSVIFHLDSVGHRLQHDTAPVYMPLS